MEQLDHLGSDTLIRRRELEKQAYGKWAKESSAFLEKYGRFSDIRYCVAFSDAPPPVLEDYPRRLKAPAPVNCAMIHINGDQVGAILRLSDGFLVRSLNNDLPGLNEAYMKVNRLEPTLDALGLTYNSKEDLGDDCLTYLARQSLHDVSASENQLFEFVEFLAEQGPFYTWKKDLKDDI